MPPPDLTVDDVRRLAEYLRSHAKPYDGDGMYELLMPWAWWAFWHEVAEGLRGHLLHA